MTEVVFEKNLGIADAFHSADEHERDLTFLAWLDGLGLVVALDLNSYDSGLVDNLLDHPSVLSNHLSDKVSWHIN